MSSTFSNSFIVTIHCSTAREALSIVYSTKKMVVAINLVYFRIGTIKNGLDDLIDLSLHHGLEVGFFFFSKM